MTDVSLFVTIMSVIILCYGLLILMGKCDKIILSKENSIIPFKADNFNIDDVLLSNDIVPIDGNAVLVANVCSSPYAVPAELTAYARM